ncbi:Uncharacterised protein [Vibrio cholerae]|nr:Uncharacterised protein [Vibrio cholerae]
MHPKSLGLWSFLQQQTLGQHQYYHLLALLIQRQA